VKFGFECKKESYKHRQKVFFVTQVRLFLSSAQICSGRDLNHRSPAQRQLPR